MNRRIRNRTYGGVRGAEIINLFSLYSIILIKKETSDATAAKCYEDVADAIVAKKCVAGAANYHGAEDAVGAANDHDVEDAAGAANDHGAEDAAN